MAASFALTGTIRIVPTWTDDLNTTTVSDSVTVNQAIALTDGDGTGEADGYWRDVRTVAASATDTIDLDDLALNVMGGAGVLDLAELKVVYVRNRSETHRLDVQFGYVSSGQQSTTKVGVKPGGVFVMTSSAAIVVATAIQPNRVLVTNAGAGAADYEIVLAGVRT